MLGGTHPDIAASVQNNNTTFVGGAHNIGVHNSTFMGSTHKTIPVGDAHRPSVSKANSVSNTETRGSAGPHASVSPTKFIHPKSIPNATPESATEKGPNICPSHITNNKGSRYTKV